MFLPHSHVKVSIVGSLRDREVAFSTSDRQGSYFESCVWRTVSSQSSHHPQEVLLAQFSLYVHKGGLNPIHFIYIYKKQKKMTILISLFVFSVSPGVKTGGYPANTRHSPNAVLMLAHRLRRWPNIKTALGECLVCMTLATASVSTWSSERLVLRTTYCMISRINNRLLYCMIYCIIDTGGQCPMLHLLQNSREPSKHRTLSKCLRWSLCRARWTNIKLIIGSTYMYHVPLFIVRSRKFQFKGIVNCRNMRDNGFPRMQHWPLDNNNNNNNHIIIIIYAFHTHRNINKSIYLSDIYE